MLKLWKLGQDLMITVSETSFVSSTMYQKLGKSLETTHYMHTPQVDMPVFFYIDPDFNDDPAMAKVDTITLSYTFFESREGDFINIPVPSRQT